jgi:hypothetical protein
MSSFVLIRSKLRFSAPRHYPCLVWRTAGHSVNETLRKLYLIWIKLRPSANAYNHHLGMLVVLQTDNDGYSWSVSVQGQTRRAVNGLCPLPASQRRHGR